MESTQSFALFVMYLSNALMVCELPSEETTETIPVPKQRPAHTAWVSQLSAGTFFVGSHYKCFGGGPGDRIGCGRLPGLVTFHVDLCESCNGQANVSLPRPLPPWMHPEQVICLA